VGTDYWRGLLDWVRATPLEYGAVSLPDLDLLKVTDEPAEVVRIIAADAAANATSRVGPAD
jgi:predicted Rossmann-fold nucleotide-binding protein